MRVAKLEAMSVAYPEPNDHGATRHLTLCRVEAADGTVGWGECVTMWPAACRATEQLIAGFEDLVVGAEVTSNVAVWKAMRDRSWWFGHGGGFVSFAISAIDIALWDLRGRVTGLSLTAMLGGAVRNRLPVIASTHAFRPTIGAEVDAHAGYVSDGFTGVKVGFGKRGDARLGYELARDVEFVRRLREAIGPQAGIMIDRGQSLPWDLEHAIRLTRALEEHGLRWMEEPFEPHDTTSFLAYRGRVDTMVGTGEREWDELGYRRVIDSGIVDVVGCDPGRAQGITGARRVIELVEEAGLWFNAHTWSSAIVTSASLALSSTTRRAMVFEMKPLENPMQHELVSDPFTQVDGWIEPRESPGLGIDVDEAVVAHYRMR